MTKTSAPVSRRRFCRRLLRGGVAVGLGLSTVPALGESSFKISKEDAEYVVRDSHASLVCAQCLYYIVPRDCMIVQGPVSPYGWCAYYYD